MSPLPMSTQGTDYLLNNPQSTVRKIADGLDHSEKSIGNEIRKNEGKLYYGSAEKYNRRWSLIEEKEEKEDNEWSIV